MLNRNRDIYVTWRVTKERDSSFIISKNTKADREDSLINKKATLKT